MKKNYYIQQYNKLQKSYEFIDKQLINLFYQYADVDNKYNTYNKQIIIDLCVNATGIIPIKLLEINPKLIKSFTLAQLKKRYMFFVELAISHLIVLISDYQNISFSKKLFHLTSWYKFIIQSTETKIIIQNFNHD